jgi:outer membrane protein
MTPTGLKAALLAGALALLAASAAQAQAQTQTDDASSDWTVFGWSVTGRLSVRVAPDYIGAKTYSVGPGGSISFHRPGSQPRFHAPDDSFSVQLFGDRAFSGGFVMRGRSARDQDKNLQGVHTLDRAWEPGVYAEWWPAEALRVHGELRRGVAGNQAWSGDLAADAVHDDPKWLLSIGPRLHLGDSRFTQTYFDVTAADAAASPHGITSYSASGAFVSAGAIASAEYRVRPRWSLMGDVGYQRLLGDAAKSPLVARLGSPDQFTAALGVRIRFGH